MCHRWWRRGERAPGTRQIGYQWAYIFSAVRPDTGDDVTLVMPSVNAKVMDLFLAHFADTLDQDAHAVMMCDGAGWHDERALTVPDNVTLALLPPYSPELNPVERVWLYLRERFLSLRVLDDTEAIIDACCQAWIDLAEPDRMRTLCAYPWIHRLTVLVLPRHRTVIFVNGCFWHWHPDPDCPIAGLPKTRILGTKAHTNTDSGPRAYSLVGGRRWRVLTVWERHLRSSDEVVNRVCKFLENRESTVFSVRTNKSLRHSSSPPQ